MIFFSACMFFSLTSFSPLNEFHVDKNSDVQKAGYMKQWELRGIDAVRDKTCVGHWSFSVGIEKAVSLFCTHQSGKV